MIEDNVLPTNGEAEGIATSLKREEVDILLLYKAKQNVKARENLIKHVIAFIVVWFGLGLLYVCFIQHMVSPEWWRISDELQILNEHIPTAYQAAVNEVRWTVEWHLLSAYTPDVWYVILGIMTAWGGWIAFRIAKRVAKPMREKIWSKFTKKDKPDPVTREYNRLKNMNADEMM